MSAIRDTYISSLLADATYARNLADGLKSAALEGRLSPRMTPTLAKFISSNFEIVSHKESGDSLLGDDSGFQHQQHQGSESNCFSRCLHE